MLILDNSSEKNILSKCPHFTHHSWKVNFIPSFKSPFKFWFHGSDLAPNTLGTKGECIRTNQVIEKENI